MIRDLTPHIQNPPPHSEKPKQTLSPLFLTIPNPKSQTPTHHPKLLHVIPNSFRDLPSHIQNPLNNLEVPFRSNQTTNNKNPSTRSLSNLRFVPNQRFAHSNSIPTSLQVGLSVPIQKIVRSHSARPIFLISPTIPHPTITSQKKTAKNKCIHIRSQRFSHIHHIQN